MSTVNENRTSLSQKFAAKIGYLAILCVALFGIWKLGKVCIENEVAKQQQLVSQTIIKTINEQAKFDLFMPEIVFINVDSAKKKHLNDSISRQIADVLTKKYINNEKVNPKKISFQPYFIYPDSVDKKGNYTITKTQLEELKNHIIFLTSQVDKAVTATKEEIDREIDRINTWVSIWIGMLSIFGTIIPLFYNYKNNEDLKKIKSDAIDAKMKADNADALITKHKPDLEKIEGISKELGTLKESFGGFKDEVELAKTSSDKALKTATDASSKAGKLEKIVSTLNDLSKIKDIDATFLLYNDKPFETLTKYLQDIHTNLNNCVELFDEPIIKDALRQLALKIYLVAPSSFIIPAHFELLNKYSLDTSNIISKPITEETYKEALTLLENLNTNLSNK